VKVNPKSKKEIPMFPKRLSLISAIVALTLLVSACGGAA